jgi:DNA-binding LacI/PurR family transcriptional regulator
MRTSIKDVARLSGVSLMTVSRVINGDPNVSEPTRCRVAEAIQALGYRPDHAARSLRRGRTRSLRLLVVRRHERFLTEPFLDEVVAGIVDAAARADYALVLEAVGPDDVASRSHGQRLVDGTILIDGRRASPLLPVLRQAEAPCVVVPSRPVDPAVGWVYADFRGGAVRLVEHLLALGHRRIAHLTGRFTVPERDRLRGYAQALRAAGIDRDLDLVVPAGHLRHHGYAAMEKLLARRLEFTAVFAVNDITALGAMECLQRHGLRVPEDVSVVGFDDIYLAPYANPPLTTMRLPAYEMGVAAVELATSAIEDRHAGAQSREFPVEFRSRASTGPPPAAPSTGRTKARQP